MNGIEKITAKLNADCEAELGIIRAETADKCQAIREAGDKAAQEEYWRLVKAGVKACEQRVSHLDRTAQMEARKSVLALKQEMVSQAFDRALAMLLELPEEQYVAFLSRKASEASVTGSETLECSARDLNGAGARIVAEANRLLTAQGRTGQLILGKEPRPIAGGFFLKEGDIQVNCSIELLVELCRSELASQVAGVMFGE